MQFPDLVNGLFELGGGMTGALNCWQLYRDKQVKGIVWQFSVFYTAWGLWNLFYYPHLGQWLSFFGGCVIVLFNAIWVCQVIYYLRHNA